MTAEQNELLDGLFTRYGRPSQESDSRIFIHIARADTIHNLNRIESSDRYAQEITS